MVLWRRRSRQRGEKSAKTRDSRFTNALAMPKRKGSSTSRPRARNKVAAKEEREARVVENAQRLDKLPQEVWEKILDELKENDLFPLALSCRYFRQKQKELVARTGQNGPESGEPPLALRTTLRYQIMLHNLQWPEKGQPASAAYLRFCRREKVSSDCVGKRDDCLRLLAAFHGHLPLLQELFEASASLPREEGKLVSHQDAHDWAWVGYRQDRQGITGAAGTSCYSRTLLSLRSASDFFLSRSSEQCLEANLRPWSG